MSVCLCDTNKKEVDIHINDCLCNQGLAIFDPDTEDDQRDYDGYQLQSSTLQVRVYTSLSLSLSPLPFSLSPSLCNLSCISHN